jgi:hypothetical protein
VFPTTNAYPTTNSTIDIITWVAGVGSYPILGDAIKNTNKQIMTPEIVKAGTAKLIRHGHLLPTSASMIPLSARVVERGV